MEFFKNQFYSASKTILGIKKNHKDYLAEIGLFIFTDSLLRSIKPYMSCDRTTSLLQHNLRPSNIFISDSALITGFSSLCKADGLYRFSCLKNQDANQMEILYKCTIDLLNLLNSLLTPLYPHLALSRYFYYLKFAVDIYYVRDDNSYSLYPDLLNIWLEFTTQEFNQVSKYMATFEKNTSFNALPSNNTGPSQSKINDLIGVTEDLIALESSSQSRAFQLSEFCSFAFQFYCCQCSRKIAKEPKIIETVLTPGSLYRRFFTLFHDSLLCCIGLDFRVGISLIEKTAMVCGIVFDTMRQYKFNEDIHAHLNNFALIGRSQVKMYSCLFSNINGLSIGDAISASRAYEKSLDTLSAKIRYFLRNHKLTLNTNPIKDEFQFLYERQYDTSEFQNESNLLATMTKFHKENMDYLKKEAIKSDARNRRLKAIHKDVKIIKGEQINPSILDKRRGPLSQCPDMVDEAIEKLRNRSLSNNSMSNNLSVVAYEVFNKWKKDKKKKGMRYTNLKSFTEIIRRKWKRIKPPIQYQS